MSTEDSKPETSIEEGIEIPFEEIQPETLRKLIEEFVSRDGADWAEAGGSLDEKVERVLDQLRKNQVKVVFDLTTGTANIIACRERP